jgi:CreA protein
MLNTMMMQIVLAAVLLLHPDKNGVVSFSPSLSLSSLSTRSMSRSKGPFSLAATQRNNNNDNNDNNDNNNDSPLLVQVQRLQRHVSKTLATASLAAAAATTVMTMLPALTLTTLPAPAAADSRVVGQLQGSGLVFKDTLQIESFDDPKVKGVTLYISTFQKPITERLGKGFFSDPAYASVGCAKTGPVAVADNIATGTAGEEVFEESRSLLFKTLRVQRIYDVEKKTVVYVSFNTRLDKGEDSNKSRFKSSLCAVALE